MKKYKKYFHDLNPQENELLEIGYEVPLEELEKIIASLGEPYGEHMYLFYSHQLHVIRNQTKEADELKPVIEKEIDPDFFKPRAQGIIR